MLLPFATVYVLKVESILLVHEYCCLMILSTLLIYSFPQLSLPIEVCVFNYPIRLVKVFDTLTTSKSSLYQLCLVRQSILHCFFLCIFTITPLLVEKVCSLSNCIYNDCIGFVADTLIFRTHIILWSIQPYMFKVRHFCLLP